MATKVQVEAALTRLVANEIKFDAWLNGAADTTVILGATSTPTLLGIIGAMSLPTYATKSLANAEMGGIGRVFINSGTGFTEVTSSAF